jgi:LAO/AO transport system ATPase/phenylacetic acid degradation protein PaaD
VKSDLPQHSQERLIAPLLAGDRGAVARAISRIERGETAGAALDAALRPHLGRAQVVGITGAPGAGKSSLVNALLGEWLRRGLRIGVVAVDPSSPITGGAVLGDRVRMGEHGAHPDVFIRSVAARGQLGGLSEGTGAIVDILDAAGFDIVVVETVGAGQSEVAIMRLADTRVVACPPGLGDGVQAIKAGILEIADILAVTKADLPGADLTLREMREMLQLRAASERTWQVPVLATSIAQAGQGIAALADQVSAHGQAQGRGRRFAAAQNAPAPGLASETGQRLLALSLRDPFVQAMGIGLVDAGPGTATVTMTLQPRHINFNGTCHGGVTFTLADTAFGLASNSHGVIAAGIDAHITYQQPALDGDTLLATAREVSRSKKLAVYRVDVTKADGTAISSFTGTVYVTSRPHPPA